MDNAERIVVTGMGVVSPVAIGVDAFHHALAAGENGISVVEFPWETGYKVLRAGCVKNFNLAQFFPDPPQMGRASQLAVAASMLALRDAGLDFPPAHSDRSGLVVGTAMGDVDEFEAAWQGFRHSHARNGDTRDLMRLGNMSDRLAAIFGLEGPNHVVASACAAGNHAIAWSAELLKRGEADVMLAVGTDTIGFVDMLGFSRLRLQAPERCQPFDLHRKGTILAEGGATLVLETLSSARRRRANILAEVAGYGIS
ncbi:MAG TPA: beta-ketoacyl synthase N-terminal-like domain-containing protein, partial [Terriglobales bacterium]|nr:beta-ketoacyl synthase N-terminal-like domain-containing protein [Terriglobales bacterium]